MTTTNSGGAAGGKLPLEIEAPINAIAMDMPWMPGTATRPLDAIRAAIVKYGDDRAAEARVRAVEECAKLCDDFSMATVMGNWLSGLSSTVRQQVFDGLGVVAKDIRSILAKPEASNGR